MNRRIATLVATGVLAGGALFGGCSAATTSSPTYAVFVYDGVYDIPAPTGAVQHCWDTGTTAVNDTGATLWDCDHIKSTSSSLGVVQCVKATGGATEPYIYCSTTGSASGANGAGHVLDRRP